MSNPRPAKQPCFQFKRNRCTFGARCKFSHDLSSSAAGQHGGPSAPSQMRSSSRKDEDDLREWKRLLRQGRFSPNRSTCDRFFELAVKLIDGDLGASQETIKLLASEDGLAYIRLLIENHLAIATAGYAKQDVWFKLLQPLFTIITHHRVVDSAVLEQQVATIYNFIQGIGGKRMRIVFNFVIDLVKSSALTSISTSNTSPTSKPVIIETCLAVLCKMVDCNTNNIIDEYFKVVSEEMESSLKGLEVTSDQYSMMQSKKWIGYIHSRLGVGDKLPSFQSHTPQTSESRAKFTLPKDFPGRLCAAGARHDNDHARITDISILPTNDEVVSTRAEYLPTNDPSSFHLPGIVGRLDREFRLLREDTVGQLRDAVRGVLEIMRHPNQKLKGDERRSLFTYMYPGAEIVDASFDQLSGLDLSVRFPQPRGATYQKRQEWWTQSKRLQPGALVCVISGDGSVLFCVVAETTIITSDQKLNGRRVNDTTQETSDQQKLSLAEDNEFSFVHLNIAELKDNNIQQALRWYRNVGPNHPKYLVEFPGVLLAAFQHTLVALQRMSKVPHVPFIDLIAPGNQKTGMVDIPPPHYATKAGFYFDLECLVTDGTKLRLSHDQYLNHRTLMKHSTLDETQSLALINSLLRGLALIQGPPGTGKSYTGEKIIKVLLANKERGDLGPILCVCYTNHALDQLLEHLLDDGVKQIVRIGSRSKSDRLEKVNLRVVARSAERTKSEKAALWEARDALVTLDSSASRSLLQLEHCLGQQALQEYLAEHHPSHHEALFGKLVDEEGFQEVQRNSHKRVDKWLRHGKAVKETRVGRQVEQLFAADLWTMTHTERQNLYHYWQRQIRNQIIRSVVFEHRDYVKTKEKRDHIYQEVDLRCLSSANVVGVTTTGLARNLNLLRRLRCKVLLCEEAGEVLEAHNLTALLPSIEHCILIGDQLQLRPQIQNYDLSSANPRGVQYSLDVSLFERLVSPSRDEEQQLPRDTLQTQRRMHPSISNLVRHTLYPALVDGEAVSKYPEIIGMKKRLFWLHHTVLEDRAQNQDPTSTSHTNSFEIEMTVALVQHLVRQGTYAPDEIAVITPYLGQLHRLRRVMQNLLQISFGERDLEDLAALDASKVEEDEGSPVLPPSTSTRTTLLKSIRLATVDNFQGEEAKVVVISLVRSNPERRCGFLSTSNRINVLLSRAKHGMYLIGNADTYERVSMWSQVISMLRNENNIGPALQLQCPRHPDQLIEASTPDHFLQFAPEGGCCRQCDRRLACGHACINRCHSQVLHNAVKCLEPCPRPKQGCDHPCKLYCGDTCEPKCREIIENPSTSLPCGHQVTRAYCWQVQEPSSIICRMQVTKTVPGCNHTVSVFCHTDVTSASYRCTSLCGDPQPCGHSCRSQCHRCKDRKDGSIAGEHHETCRQPCNRAYTACSHACLKACHGENKCPPCPRPCEVRCSHSKCGKQCQEPCVPCAEKDCSSSCPHQKCTMPCAAPCDWIPCSKRCEQILTCGHQCPSLCGESCPNTKYCQVCGTDDIKSSVVDFIMGTQYHQVDLDEDPCIFPDCGHFFTMTNMDGIMDLKAHYEMSPDLDSCPIALCTSSAPFSMDEVKTCPSCRGSLRNIARYGKIIRRAMLDEATKKFITWSNSGFLQLADQLVDVQMALAETPAPTVQRHQGPPTKLVISKGRLQQLELVNSWVGHSRYKDAVRLWTHISGFIRQVRREEQPLQRVANHVQHAIKQRRTTSAFTFDESALQVKGVLQAIGLLLKCEIAVFTDFMTVRLPLIPLRPEINLNLSQQLKECENLIGMAKLAHYPREQVEGHIYFAKFCAFARTLAPEPPEPAGDSASDGTTSDIREQLKSQATTHITTAKELLNKYPSTHVLEPDVEGAEKMLRDAVFYTKVSAEEMRAVYKAMSREFSGTGHWYNCVNGHPFTIGECGMPMEQARCPECGSPVGGANHQSVEGVQRANEIDELARGMNRVNI
ncbi:hypothetical protein F5B22DRAFT_626229 [Xylaria bambusicola]|uniref:uncharacterized protein n=1 Tax=Xylaria bambusicola TaxID=326684 RepID=UPI0020073622|nr:uncharacterized protein F5B22DRAFT_626229 [Xylaria bambusicola]KAI0505882.1 hypothetical protein F5B22DRAFT_626229 [Xylaria bambusicola]